MAEARIAALIEAWAAAVRRHDLTAILAYHAPDIVMFDVPPPLQSRGLDAYRKTWELFFTWHQADYAFDIETLDVTAGTDVAFAVAILRCGPDPAFQFRLTVGLRKLDGEWRITHEHHSVPAED